MKQPLHFSQTNRDLIGWLKARAHLAFFMTQLSAAVGRRYTHPFSRADTPGFRTSRKNDFSSVTFLEDRMIQADMLKRPRFVPNPRQVKRAEAKAEFRERFLADQTSGLSGLSNYEMGRYLLAARAARRTGQKSPDPRDFVGIRGWSNVAA